MQFIVSAGDWLYSYLGLTKVESSRAYQIIFADMKEPLWESLGERNEGFRDSILKGFACWKVRMAVF